MSEWKWLETIFPSQIYVFKAHQGELGRLFATPEELEVLDWLDSHIAELANSSSEIGATS